MDSPAVAKNVIATGASQNNRFVSLDLDLDLGFLFFDYEQGEDAIRIYREGGNAPILTQNALPDKRPYLHPVVAPDGKGVMTEYRPSHHLHQTGIFWGFKLVNGRDFLDYVRHMFVQREAVGEHGSTITHHLDNKVRPVSAPRPLAEPEQFDLHARASRWHEGQGLMPAAIKHALASRDYTMAVRLIRRGARRRSRGSSVSMM